MIQKEVIQKAMYNFIAKSAYKVTEMNVNSCCMFLAYQDKLPKAADKLKKH